MGHVNSKIHLVKAAENVKVLLPNNTRKSFKVSNKSLLAGNTPVGVKIGSSPAAADVNGVMDLTFSQAPNKGSFKLEYQGQQTASISSAALAADVQTALRALPGLSAITVTGSFAAGFVVTMVGAPAPNPLLKAVENTLAVNATPAEQNISFTPAPESGSFRLLLEDYRNQINIEHLSKSIAWNESSANIQTILRNLLNDGSLAVTGGIASGLNIVFGITGAKRAFKVVESNLKADIPDEQLISFSAVPDSGSFKLVYGAGTTAAILFSDNAAAVQAALRAIAGLESVTVTGNFTTGFVVTFVGAPGDVALLTTTENTLQNLTVPVVITITEQLKGIADAPSVASVQVVAEGNFDIPVTGTVAINTVAKSDADSEEVKGEAFIKADSNQEVWIKAHATSNVEIEVSEIFD